MVAVIKQWNRRRQYRDAVAGGWNPYLHGGRGGAGGGPPERVRAGASASAGIGAEPQAPQMDPRTRQIFDLRAEISNAVSSHELPRAADLYIDLKLIDPQQVLRSDQSCRACIVAWWPVGAAAGALGALVAIVDDDPGGPGEVSPSRP